MKQSEFTTFLASYSSLLPSFGRWLSRCQEDAKAAGIVMSKEDILKRWWEQLANVPLWVATSALKRASDRRELSDRDHERNLFVIRDLALEILRSDVVSDRSKEWSDYSCDFCGGLGIVLIHASDNPKRRAAVACGCARGESVKRSMPRIRVLSGSDKLWGEHESVREEARAVPSSAGAKLLATALRGYSLPDGSHDAIVSDMMQDDVDRIMSKARRRNE